MLMVAVWYSWETHEKGGGVLRSVIWYFRHCACVLFFVWAVFIGPFCFSVPSASNCVSLPVPRVLLLVVLLTSVLAASYPAFVVDVSLPGSHILNYSAPS